MLRLANVSKGDVLYDLGSGDGRIAIAAAKKFGIRRSASTSTRERISEATENAKKAGVTNLVSSARRTCSRPTSARPPWSRCTCCPTST